MRASLFFILPCVLALHGCYFSSFSAEAPVDQGGPSGDGQEILVRAESATIGIAPAAAASGGGAAHSELFLTLPKGESALALKGVVSCVPKDAVCTPHWEFLSLKKRVDNTLEPAPVTLGRGFHRVVLTVTTVGDEVVGRANAYVSAWDGVFSDDFNRNLIDADNQGWLTPRGSDYQIRDGWLFARLGTERDGAPPITAYPVLTNLRASVILRRSPYPWQPYRADIFLRVNPLRRDGARYRVRIERATEAEGNRLQMAVIKLTADDPTVGVVLSDLSQPITDLETMQACKLDTDCLALAHGEAKVCRYGRCLPSSCVGCVSLQGFDPKRERDLHVTIELRDVAGVPTFAVTLADSRDSSRVYLLQEGIEDRTPQPIGAGLVALGHLGLDGYFDDILIEDLSAPAP